MKAATLLVVAGGALALFGVLWTTCSLVATLRFPVAGYGAWNLLAGLALIATGGAMVLRGFTLRSLS